MMQSDCQGHSVRIYEGIFYGKIIRQENEKKFVLDGFLDAAQQFNKEFKEEIEKEKEEYLKRQGFTVC